MKFKSLKVSCIQVQQNLWKADGVIIFLGCFSWWGKHCI